MEKITSSITPIEQVNKINEIIDNMGSRYIGEIIQSTIPLSDAGLHLLDGSLIQGNGIYADFVNYIASLINTYPNLFVTEATWQTSVSNYGVCGKFVYDNVNNTVRLPKITGFIEGTTNINALGDLISAGLPNITGVFYSGTTIESSSGAFVVGNNPYRGSTSGSGNNQMTFDASHSSSIYGNSNTVQPQAIKVLYYICIATATKTDIEVDIDEIATDLANITTNLNSKADKSSFQVVSVLPVNPDANTFYFIPE